MRARRLPAGLNRLLQHDDAVVQLFVNEMYRATGDRDSVFERLALRVKAGKGRQQRRMDVEDPLREGAHELR